jgi:hypothetical protein
MVVEVLEPPHRMKPTFAVNDTHGLLAILGGRHW